MAVSVPAVATAQDFVTLFDGKDLSKWTTTSTHWAVKEGVLALENRTDAAEHNDSYLWTAEQYGDFILELEYKAPAGRANSGVFIRTSDKNDPVQTGIEIQIGNVNPSRGLSRNTVGGIYDLAAPAADFHKPGEWNHYRITCQGGKIAVMLNGKPSAEADLDLYTQTGLNPDGSKNKFSRPLKEFARQGYIGLQDHGVPVWYRNIRVKRL